MLRQRNVKEDSGLHVWRFLLLVFRPRVCVCAFDGVLILGGNGKAEIPLRVRKRVFRIV